MTEFVQRLDALRARMARAGVGGYLIPKEGPYLGEYRTPHDERLAWISGFTGTAGLALVLPDRAVLFSDARYTIQMREQTDRRHWQTVDSRAPGLTGWIEGANLSGMGIGYDPALHAHNQIQKWMDKLEAARVTLIPCADNLVDAIWTDRPAAPHTGVEPFLESFAGTSALDKIKMIAADLTAQKLAAAWLSDPADLAWLLNIRARDSMYTPVAFSSGVIYADGQVEWVIDPLRVPLDIKKTLAHVVQITPPEAMDEVVMRLKARAGKEPVQVDESCFSQKLALMFDHRNIVAKVGQSPIVRPRAMKTPAEQAAIRDTHRKDAVAMIRFLAWFDEEAPKGGLDEMGVVEKLLSFRKLDPAFRGPSFPPVSAFGTNSASPHYTADERNNRRIDRDGLLLFDTGGQYVGGTTDITRTIAVGEPSEDMRTRYTATLKAHIAVARAIFPKGTTGAFFDSLARAQVWQEGIDFGHSLGHGVGCYLGVHEPGVWFASKSNEDVPQGALVSNEPAFYIEGAYGARLENLVLVVPYQGQISDPRPFYALDTVSLVPFDPNLTKLSMLTEEEREWLAAYHTQILDEIGPVLPEGDRAWLETVCAYFC